MTYNTQPSVMKVRKCPNCEQVIVFLKPGSVAEAIIDTLKEGSASGQVIVIDKDPLVCDKCGAQITIPHRSET